MFKKFGIALVFVMLAVLAYGTISTGAWFTDREQQNVSVSTGNFNLGLEVKDGGTWTLANIEPGDYGTVGTFCFSNDGTYDMNVKGYVEVQTTGGADLKDALLMEVIINPEGSGFNYPNTSFSYPSGLNSLAWLESQGPVVSNLAGYVFDPGSKACVQVDYKLPTTATNTVLNETVTVKFFMDATQTGNTNFEGFN